MIKVELNRQNFEYDVHSLVKAFYPEEDVQIAYTQEAINLAAAQQNLEEGALPNAAVTQRTNHKKAPEEERKESLKLVISFVGDEAAESECEVNESEKSDPATQNAANRSGPASVQGCIHSEIFGEEDVLLAKDEMFVDWTRDRKEVKNELKRQLYRLLSAYTGQKLPWGNLTGIRPTKIPMALLEQGWKNSEIAEYMRNTYYTSNEKTALAIAIANKERHLLQDIHYKNGYSLYVGIPFCPSICLYCSFSSSPLHLWKDKVDLYLDALCKEIDYVSDAFAEKELNTVYIGGGTPTTLEPYQLDRLLTKLEDKFCYDKLKEFTVEAGRPDSITREKLEVLRTHNISRISINPQTMNQKTLDLIGRKHTVEETIRVFEMARELGFDNINMDLIVGLPGEEKADVEYTMQQLAKLDPDSVTVHSLAVKRAARLRMFKEEHKEMTMTNNQEIMDMTAEYARQSGLYPYYLYRQKNMAGNFENVGYAKEGKEGIYNILIMEEVQSILALGAGASTKMVWAHDRIERIENVKDIKSYIERIDEMIARKKAGLYDRSQP